MTGRKREIVIATRNPGKAREFAHAFAALEVAVKSLLDYPSIPDIPEDGSTFADNARIKAKTASELLGVPALADDSGLCVDALDGAPGVYSARYAGKGASDADNNAKLLAELTGRGAETLGTLPDGTRLLSRGRFVCVLALYDPERGAFIEAEGEVAGFIADRPRGSGGFGYDPLFWLPELGRSMAELTQEEKRAISHRGKALEALLNRLRER